MTHFLNFYKFYSSSDIWLSLLSTCWPGWRASMSSSTLSSRWWPRCPAAVSGHSTWTGGTRQLWSSSGAGGTCQCTGGASSTSTCPLCPGAGPSSPGSWSPSSSQPCFTSTSYQVAVNSKLNVVLIKWHYDKYNVCIFFQFPSVFVDILLS